MTIEEELHTVSRGADFIRADLHIHSFGAHGSYDVADPTMTPGAIVDTALKEHLDLIAITDHNEIGNVEEVVGYAADKDIAVIPGVELSTPQGHLLVYLPTVRELRKFYGKLTISDDQKTCAQTISQCLDSAGELGGFGIAAHVDLTTGLEAMMPRFDPFKEAVLLNRNLLGLEISTVGSNDWYTHADPSPDRKRLYDLRRTRHSEDENYELAKIMSSDAHALTALGRNAAGARKLTRIKMDVTSFDALRIALIDSTARVRIEDVIPSAIPHFVGLKLTGGFLDEALVHFSKNLTCIIGGRGTGKSTMLESLRAAAGRNPTSSLVDSDVWPDRIDLLYEDQSGRKHHLLRPKFYEVMNKQDPISGITAVPIESYGQGETAETIHHCDKEPTILLEFLDGFVNATHLKAEDDELRDRLLANQTEIERLRLDINTLPDVLKAQAHAEAQLRTLKEKDAASIVDEEERLARGRRFKTELINNLTVLFKNYQEALTDSSLNQVIAGLDGSQLVVGKEEFERVKKLVEDYIAEIAGVAKSVTDRSRETIHLVNEALGQWQVREVESQKRIDTIRKELEGRGVKLDMSFIRKVAKDVTDFTAKVVDLKNKQNLLAKALEERKGLVGQRRALKSRLFVERTAFANSMNANLRDTVVDYFVTVRYREGTLSSELESIIKDTLGWRTSQVPRATLIAAGFSPFELIAAIQKGDPGKLLTLRADDGQAVFTQAEAKGVLNGLSGEKCQHAIERCAFEDRPEIIVTKESVGADGKKVYLKRDFSKLSLGQQQSVLLSILLFSSSNEPLIIDQPEDNLDSEFVYKTFVRSLRRVKERRQVIVVTHNANIAVLGDAELILPLRATSEKSIVRDRGSIDNPTTKDLACTILEGSVEAFKRRQKMYQH